jgi:hypothetical protein
MVLVHRFLKFETSFRPRLKPDTWGGRVRVIGDCVRESFHSRGSAENPVLNQATVEYLLPGRQSAAFTSAFERLLDEPVH